MINDLLKNITQGMESTLRSLRVEVREHAGKFTWQELTARSYRAPAVFVSCLGWRELTEAEAVKQALPLGDNAPSRMRFAAGVVTKHAKGSEERNIQARLICQMLTVLLNRNDWDLNLIGEANDVRAEALFVPQAEADNQSLWLVSWWHPVALDDTLAKQLLNEFITAHGEHYAAPGEHTDDQGADIPLASLTETLPK